LKPLRPVNRLDSVTPSTALSRPVDPDFLEDVYRANWASLVRLGMFLVGSREVAEDIVQDAFIRLDAGAQFPDYPRAYLRRMVINGVTDYRRRLKVEADFAHEVPLWDFIPEVEEVWSRLCVLSDRQRDALVFRFYLDLSIQEVASLLGCPTNTAKTHIRRGLLALRKEVDP
jgi:RNA polymerase sigma factor (sigma-70 family)